MRSGTLLLLLAGAITGTAGCAQLANHAPMAPEMEAIMAPALIEDAMPISETSDQSAFNTTENDLGLIQRLPEISPEFYTGSGVFIGQTPAQSRLLIEGDEDDQITLNFKSTDIHDLAKVLLGDVLKRNYVIDPAVSGTVNIQTNRPFHKDNLITILQDLLQMHGATLVETNSLVKIVPISTAGLSSLPPQVGTGPSFHLGGGTHTQIVPLQYIGAEEVNKILQPFLKDAVSYVYPERNLIMLSGTQGDLNRLLSTIQMFDVDWLQGMSMAMVPLQYAEATDIVQELEGLFGQASKSPLASLIRFMPLNRLNSVIVVTQQPRYLHDMTQWIKRLDRSDGIEGYQLYVYPVQNKRAEELAAVLNNIFNNQPSQTVATNQYASLAPGQQPVTLQGNDPNNPNTPTINNNVFNQVDPTTVAQTRQALATINQQGVALPGKDAVRIIADESDNSLVILASPYDYQMVERAIKKLDTIPLQVLIEASIIEVTLSDELSYGLEWFFKNGISGSKNGLATLDLNAPADLSRNVPGFSYGIVDSSGLFRGIFNTLANEDRVNLISSPSLMVLDNHTATINIGEQVPILTSQSTSNLTDNAVTVNQVEYRDTGVIMNVTPRVNASGLIVLDITQEVTSAFETTISGIGTPTFTRRSIESTISVNNGNSVVLGGLIEDKRSTNQTGIPGLHKAPIIGPLFGQTSNNMDRTELVVVLTPKAIMSENDALKVTNEFKNRLEVLRGSIDELKQSKSTYQAP